MCFRLERRIVSSVLASAQIDDPHCIYWARHRPRISLACMALEASVTGDQNLLLEPCQCSEDEPCTVLSGLHVLLHLNVRLTLVAPTLLVERFVDDTSDPKHLT